MSPPARRKVLHVFDQIPLLAKRKAASESPDCVARGGRRADLASGISYLAGEVEGWKGGSVEALKRKRVEASGLRPPEPVSLKTQHPKLNTPPPLPAAKLARIDRLTRIAA